MTDKNGQPLQVGDKIIVKSIYGDILGTVYKICDFEVLTFTVDNSKFKTARATHKKNVIKKD